ncbi:aluminum-activated malate transporter 2-like [Amaranthus tricolor]|uniref:aluminum-activated malate transporter 2-like n=1 Tax=Amaranthus tricolor TaxID=29722 RepID=UPI002589859A|nr:aluminum-activated malate transporter 2-like [Amaranthus tricolor]
MMEPAIVNNDSKSTIMARMCCWPQDMSKSLIANVVTLLGMTKKLAKDDPRRVIYSLKVGLALTLVSLFYYFQPLYNTFDDSATWAIITVVVVFEYTVGATLVKGLNRAMGTFLAVALAAGTNHLASLFGNIGEAILIGLFVFIFATTSTFIRFFPKIKRRYDYVFLIFILTFSFISVLGFREETHIIEIAHKRMSTVAIGIVVTVLINILIYPIWAGQELHNSIALNMEKIGQCLQGFGAVYMRTDGEAKSKDTSKSYFQGYQSVLHSKSSEETLANFARWEPPHGQFRYRHPWNKYVKLGFLSRQCAYRIDALKAYCNLDIKLTQKFQEEIKEACIKMSLESGNALKELSVCVREMKYPSSLVNAHICSSKAELETLKTLLKSISLYNNTKSNQQSEVLIQTIPMVTVVYLLTDIVDYTEKMAATTYELATIACLGKSKVMNAAEVSPKKSANNFDETNNQPTNQLILITIAEQSDMTANSLYN